ncbi:uncharacterized protein [Physcomitrium patens]|uniref:uncharacterized protein isoform X4 n=1 Tax=Physcomitrium patens TaxID=3218 RepID=UPI000D160BC4|nr:uncharacterized protein LOC112281932 isoform X4 [Physcomitrium patens]|eukprot:XP_024374746.1 uncharacterized protein LOC112281932 isoform X4 [Physcomitrella patens]
MRAEMYTMEISTCRVVGIDLGWRHLVRLAKPPCAVTLSRGITNICPFNLKCGEPKLQALWSTRVLRSSRRPSSLSVASIEVEPTINELRMSPSAQDILEWDLEGWKVVLEETGEVVGRVEEVLNLCSFWDPSVVEYCMLKVFDSNSPGIEYLIPWVEDIVKEVDCNAERIFIKPPEGLLELAKRPELLRKIRTALEEFGLHTEGQKEPHMPTRRQLQAAGEYELVEMIMDAGGFSSVAQDLRLRTKRRPVGYWEDLQNLDSEIEAFLAESWREEQNPETAGKTYYVNLVTREQLAEKPASPSIMDPTPVSMDWSDTGTAVMPRAHILRKLGRFDLHNAITMHGGYKEVAQQLGRMHLGRREVTDLESEIRNFMREHNLSLFPKPSQLIAEKQEDLLAAVREHGGVVAVAKKMGLRAQRNGGMLYGAQKGRWKNVEEAAQAMKEYMLENMLDSYPEIDRSDAEHRRERIWAQAVKEGSLRLPKQADILEDGRRDLRYALQKFGQESIAERLGIKVLTMRRPRIRRA